MPICLDTQGAQVRCGRMADGVEVRPGETVRLTAADVLGSADRFSLWPASVFETLRPGATVGVDFDGAVLSVLDVEEGCARAIVGSALNHGALPSVLVRHAPTGRFLSADGTWTDDRDRAVVFSDVTHATRVLDRLSCEPVFDLVTAAVAAAHAA